MFGGGSLLVFWRVLYLPAEAEPAGPRSPRPLTSVVLNIALIESATRFLSRAPKRSSWDVSAHVPTLTTLSRRFDTPTPRLVADNRSTTGAKLRGWGDRATIVIDSYTVA